MSSCRRLGHSATPRPPPLFRVDPHAIARAAGRNCARTEGQLTPEGLGRVSHPEKADPLELTGEYRWVQPHSTRPAAIFPSSFCTPRIRLPGSLRLRKGIF